MIKKIAIQMYTKFDIINFLYQLLYHKNMETIKRYLSNSKIQKEINNISNEIIKKKISNIHCIVVLKGGSYFFFELMKNLTKKNISVTFDFVKISTYEDTKSSEKICYDLDIKDDIKNKNVLIVEDIVDTGFTMRFLLSKLKKKKPKTIRVCTLLNKKCKRKYKVKIDFSGFIIPDIFVVGFGMDYNEKYRNLNYVGYLKNK